MEHKTREDTITEDSVSAVCQTLYAQPHFQSICIAEIIPEDIQETYLEDLELEQLSLGNVRKMQRMDRLLGPCIHNVQNGFRPRREELPESAWNPSLYRQFDSLAVSRGTLYREVSMEGETKRQLVIPEALIPTVLRSLHNQMGHLAVAKTLSLCRDRFYWPSMSKDVDNWIARCNRCVRRKTPTKERAPLVSIRTTQPLELVCLDYLNLEPSKGNYQNISWL
ncbi:uncharacterized protein LOC132564964 [Ylistrum balloti]|uniref:uncharacterized protein LOC132564964 n=1 Tax=Ylistrum balloti TaxID=509963 RepID=UPI002905E555|nr:uncharacterized protein LOC132564964 [Ylistrum balloti]